MTPIFVVVIDDFCPTGILFVFVREDLRGLEDQILNDHTMLLVVEHPLRVELFYDGGMLLYLVANAIRND